MKRLTSTLGVTMAALALTFSPPLEAQQTGEDRLRALEDRIKSLESEVETLKAALTAATPEPAAAAAAPAPAPAPVEQASGLPVYGGGTGAKALNPDISLIGNMFGTVGRNTVQPSPALEFTEAELGLQAIIDPFARGDVFIAFGNEGVELEEAYLTFTSLPAGFVAKAGKMKSAFGVVNTLHTHNLPWTDRPLMNQNLVGGDEGLADFGASVSRILPSPKGLFLEATGQVYRGESEGLFTATRRSDVSYLGRLRGYHDFSESTNLDVGLSYARGHNELGSEFLTKLYGTDVTLRWKPLRRAIYSSFLWRTEFSWSQRQDLLDTQRAFGFYTAADYRFNRRWTGGLRLDYAERALDPSLTDRGFSALVTYWPSEFSQLRGQYRFTRFGEGINANEFRMQLLFIMGAHGAHPF